MPFKNYCLVMLAYFVISRFSAESDSGKLRRGHLKLKKRHLCKIIIQVLEMDLSGIFDIGLKKRP